jgi:hypothetical protein
MVSMANPTGQYRTKRAKCGACGRWPKSDHHVCNVRQRWTSAEWYAYGAGAGGEEALEHARRVHAQEQMRCAELYRRARAHYETSDVREWTCVKQEQAANAWRKS